MLFKWSVGWSVCWGMGTKFDMKKMFFGADTLQVSSHGKHKIIQSAFPSPQYCSDCQAVNCGVRSRLTQLGSTTSCVGKLRGGGCWS